MTKPPTGVLRWLGAGIITGAADDDPSAIGTYASAGAMFGLAFLWVAPALLPMMLVVVYVAAKLGRVYGKGLFAAVRDQFPGWILWPAMVGAFTGNVIEAAANLGGMTAAAGLFLDAPPWVIAAGFAAGVTALQWWGRYERISWVFRILALTLFAYVAAAIMAKPHWGDVLRGTFMPSITWNADMLAMLVACIGTALSAYVYTWQSNQEVEERIASGDPKPSRHRGASPRDVARMRRDVVVGMVFSNLILYFIILASGATLFQAGHHQVDSAAQAAAALEPLAGKGARWLFAAGVVGVGFLAFPVMTTGAAYDIAQALGHPSSLHATPREAPVFYGTIVVVSALAVGMNLLGINPMRALVWSGMVQGFSVPPLLFLMMRMSGNRQVMGEHANGPWLRAAGWATTLVTAAATVAFLVLHFTRP